MSARESDSARALTPHPDEGTVRWGAGAARFETVAVGRQGAMRIVDPWAVRVVLGDGETRRMLWDGVTEWWRGRGVGLEHGVTLETRPAGQGALVVEIASSLSPRAIDDDAIALLGGAGEQVATYRHLVVYDASHARVPARMAVRGARIALEIDDTDARYPLVVDPLFALDDESSIAFPATNGPRLAGDATLSRVVAASMDSIDGLVKVFERTGTTWTDTGALRSSADDATSFGSSVQMSAAGDRIAVMMLRRDETSADTRAIEVFRRDAGGWVSEVVLSLSDATPYVPRASTLSADGARLAVDVGGRIEVFARTGTSWSAEAAIVGVAGRVLAFDGTASRLASEASIWRWTGTEWVVEATLPLGGTGDVAFSPDATRLAVGNGERRGRVYLYLRSGSAWSLEATLESPRPIGGTDHATWDNDFGASLAFGPDARRLFVGAPYDDLRAGAENDHDVGSLSVFQRVGSTWTHEAIVFGRELRLGTGLRVDETGTRVVVGAVGVLRVLRVTEGVVLGEVCGGDANCLSGHCADGVCCESACGGGVASDCQACATSLTGVPSGSCAPLSASLAPTVTCRASGSECDPAEVCTAGSMACPSDALAPSTVVCRPAATLCDAPERCTGASATCPGDAPAPAGTVCREAVSLCDVTEACDGAGFGCPSDVRAAAEVTCRASAGPCDVPERCDGVTATCPNDAFMAAGSLCGAAGPGACDAPDVCAGTSADCIATFLSGAECRASVGACDPAEVCSGTSDLCPPDAVHPAATVCRAPTSSCDVPESCDGVAAQCPPDETTCTGAEDAGVVPTDAGVADASASTPDAATAPTPATGCACRASDTSSSGAAWWVMIGALAVLWTARRRRPDRSDVC